jgi:hypothetical protein
MANESTPKTSNPAQMPFRLYILNKHARAWSFYTFATLDEATDHMWSAGDSGAECAYAVVELTPMVLASGERFPYTLHDIVVFGTHADINQQHVGWFTV